MKMSPLVLSFAFAILLNAFLSIGALTIGATSAPTADQDCNKFSVQDCSETTLPDAIQEQKMPTHEKCQILCNEVYDAKCQFFIYKHIDQTCSIYDTRMDLEKFLDNDCTTVGGFKSLDKCSQSSCSTFIHKDCEPAGNNVFNFSKVDSEEGCRNACNDLFANCKYYLYDRGDQTCTGYEEVAGGATMKNCKYLIGKENTNSPIIKNEMCNAFFDDIISAPAVCAN